MVVLIKVVTWACSECGTEYRTDNINEHPMCLHGEKKIVWKNGVPTIDAERIVPMKRKEERWV